jgi:hypothetical protein
MIRKQVSVSANIARVSSDFGVEVKFAGDGDEIFLQYLQRHHAAPRSPVLGNEFDSSTLLRRRSPVVRVNKDIGIEETTTAHGSRRD